MVEAGIDLNNVDNGQKWDGDCSKDLLRPDISESASISII